MNKNIQLDPRYALRDEMIIMIEKKGFFNKRLIQCNDLICIYTQKIYRYAHTHTMMMIMMIDFF